MIDRIALKRLTASDLTFFETLFRTLNAGNQKAINLNADVFVDRLYPSLPGLVPILGDVIPLTVTILGPAAAPAYVLSRAVTKRDAYKNWRLNGEFIRDPEGEAGRFDMLQAGDLAVMEFGGEPGPQRVTLQLLAAASATDASLHAALDPLIRGGRRTMVQITRVQIAAAAASAPETHPIWRIATDPEFDAALEDAAQNGLKGSAILKTKVTKIVTAAVLAAAKAAAEQNGRDGEALAWVHLQKMKEEGAWTSITWSSSENAVSPFDFEVVDPGGSVIRIDAKSTTGEFARLIHMSAGELTLAAEGGRYDLWRIYGITEDGARLRISENIGVFAKLILDAITPPAGVTIDSVSIDPSLLKWGTEIAIERPDETI
jgi:hypothetical protein